MSCLRAGLQGRGAFLNRGFLIPSTGNVIASLAFLLAGTNVVHLYVRRVMHHPFYPIVNINLDLASTACFADYGSELFREGTSQKEQSIVRERLIFKIGVLLELLYKEGYRTFLCPVGGELGIIAASAVLGLKTRKPDVELVPVQANIQSRDAGNAFSRLMRWHKTGVIGRRLSALQACDIGYNYTPFISGRDTYSIQNALMIGLSSTVITFFPGAAQASTPGQIPASLALAKQLNLRIINLCSDKASRQYENRVEPFIRAAISCPSPTCPVEYLCGLWILEHEYGMESGDREWRHLRSYSTFECEWNLKDDGEAEIYYNARSVLSDTFLYDQEIGTLSLSSKCYIIKDLTGNHLELLDCTPERGIHLLTLHKIHWNRPAASIRQRAALSLIGRWLHTETCIKDDTQSWQSLPQSKDFPDEWIFINPNTLTVRYPNKTEEQLKYAYCPLNQELFIEQNRELCIDDVYRVEELSPTRIRLYLMESVDIFPEQCQVRIELEKE